MVWTLFVVAQAGGWTLDPAHPPARLGEVPLLGPGAVRLSVDGRAIEARGSAVLTLRPGVPVPDTLREVGRPLGASERSWSVPAEPGEDALDVALRWKVHPAVRSSSPNFVQPRVRTSFDDPEVGAQWYHEVLDFDVLAETSLGDPSVRVAVIDGPIDHLHPDLAAGVVDPWDALELDDDPRPEPGAECPEGDSTSYCDHHGTSSAGIITARSNNGIDIVGLCSECSLVPIKLIDEGATLEKDVLAFEHAIASDAAVINNSWGFGVPTVVPDVLADVIRRAATEPRDGLGALVVFAAGNDDREITPYELHAMDEVYTVGATDRYGFATAYTNRGPAIDIAAPSATVSLAAGGGLNTTYGGTSAAAPVVSGIAGWALSVDPELSAAELATLLDETADPVNEDGSHDDVFGYGYLDPLALHNRLLGIEDADGDGESKGCSSAPGAGSVLWLGLVGLLGLRRR